MISFETILQCSNAASYRLAPWISVCMHLSDPALAPQAGTPGGYKEHAVGPWKQGRVTFPKGTVMPILGSARIKTNRTTLEENNFEVMYVILSFYLC